MKLMSPVALIVWDSWAVAWPEFEFPVNVYNLRIKQQPLTLGSTAALLNPHRTRKSLCQGPFRLEITDDPTQKLEKKNVKIIHLYGRITLIWFYGWEWKIYIRLQYYFQGWSGLQCLAKYPASELQQHIHVLLSLLQCIVEYFNASVQKSHVGMEFLKQTLSYWSLNYYMD